jgi:hypothetical protein
MQNAYAEFEGRNCGCLKVTERILLFRIGDRALVLFTFIFSFFTGLRSMPRLRGGMQVNNCLAI